MSQRETDVCPDRNGDAELSLCLVCGRDEAAETTAKQVAIFARNLVWLKKHHPDDPRIPEIERSLALSTQREPLKPLHEYACEDVVELGGYWRAETALHNALSCDAYSEELANAARAAERVADEASALARRFREAARG